MKEKEYKLTYQSTTDGGFTWSEDRTRITTGLSRYEVEKTFNNVSGRYMTRYDRLVKVEKMETV
ncbi:hypothetical protein [Klebsiella quasipneumoniae]|uniref:hypothetical protein n=1 Tax=Klebsiella quasipneumoniae TaxID=1463165 RepID=UPI002E762FA1|nr:hypothetical protein [Klebsiella quasipneumoniae]